MLLLYRHRGRLVFIATGIYVVVVVFVVVERSFQGERYLLIRLMAVNLANLSRTTYYAPLMRNQISLALDMALYNQVRHSEGPWLPWLVSA